MNALQAASEGQINLMIRFHRIQTNYRPTSPTDWWWWSRSWDGCCVHSASLLPSEGNCIKVKHAASQPALRSTVYSEVVSPVFRPMEKRFSSSVFSFLVSDPGGGMQFLLDVGFNWNLLAGVRRVTTQCSGALQISLYITFHKYPQNLLLDNTTIHPFCVIWQNACCMEYQLWCNDAVLAVAPPDKFVATELH